jgi:gentisate 1,2-dioxygenase
MLKRFRLNALALSDTRLLPEVTGDRIITHGGVYVFKPGEMAHPEPHVHQVDELFIFVQGKGVLPIDGVNHPIETGDVILVEAGEDHHTTSSVEEPLVAVWYLFNS